MDAFCPTGDLFAAPYGRADVFTEFLGLSPEDYAIFTTTGSADWFKLYGYSDAASAQSVLKSAQTLANRLGISYEDLVNLLRTGFINPWVDALSVLQRLGASLQEVYRYEGQPGYPPFTPAEQASFEQKLGPAGLAWLKDTWNSGALQQVLVLQATSADCTFDQVTLATGSNQDPAALDFLKINLFVRLWKKLGWTMDEVDRALQAFALQLFLAAHTPVTADTLGQAFKTALLYLAHLEWLNQQVDAGANSRVKLLTLWTDLPTNGYRPLYAQLFLTASILKDDPVFDDPLNQYLSQTSPLKIGDHMPALQAALNLTGGDIDQILQSQNLDRSSGLTVASASLLYRHGLLARVLNLSVHDLLALEAISGLNPFQPLIAGPVAKVDDDHPLAQTLPFVSAAATLAGSSFQVADLDYLLRHQFDPQGKYRPDPNVLAALARSLADGLDQIQTATAAPANNLPVTDTMLQQRLALALPTDAVNTFMAMWNGTITYKAVDSAVAPGSELNPADFSAEPAIQVSYDGVTTQRLTYTGVLLTGQVQLLKQAHPSPVFAGLIDQVRQQVQDFSTPTWPRWSRQPT